MVSVHDGSHGSVVRTYSASLVQSNGVKHS